MTYCKEAGSDESVSARKISAPSGSFLSRFLRRPCLLFFPWFAVVFRHCLLVFALTLKTYRLSDLKIERLESVYSRRMIREQANLFNAQIL